MKAIFDETSANDVHAENQQVQAWEQSEKNRILKMTSPQKKQLAWKELFPKLICSKELDGTVW